jgi:hypothetical protein
MLEAKDFFYCYNKHLFSYLKDEGFDYIFTAYHITTHRQFFLFERTEELSKALDTYFELKKAS